MALIEGIREQIAAYRGDRTDEKLDAAWESMCALWSTVAVPDEPDEEGPLYGLCVRLAYGLEAEGFDPDDEDDEDLLQAAACDVYDFLPADRDVIDRGEEGRLDDDGYLCVDLVQGKVIVSEQPVRPEWSEPIKRTAPKIGRNEPCPCGRTREGRVVKYKKCCLQSQKQSPCAGSDGNP